MRPQDMEQSACAATCVGMTGNTSYRAARRSTAPSQIPHPNPEMEKVERLARLMDLAIRVPGLGFRIGLDGLLGLIPGVGDAASLLPAGYIIYKAHRMGAPRRLVAQMLVNAGADAALGTVPLLGDIFDFAFKANRRNVELLRRHVQTAAPPPP